jgi:metallophosphoesterase superfamily enzyme
LSKSVTQTEERTKQMIIDRLRDIEWDIMQGNTDVVMAKLEEAQKLTREWRGRKT